jgi:hypothetical protein
VLGLEKRYGGAKLIAFGTHGVHQECSCASSHDEQKKEIVSARSGLCR